MATLNWNYIAGFTDGEGYIGIVGRGPRVTWGQKDREQSEAVKRFLEQEGLHPQMYLRRPGPKQTVGIYAINLGRRDEVRRVVETLEPLSVLKAAACRKVREWIDSHPAKSNRNPIDRDTLARLAAEGFTQGAIAAQLGCESQKVWKFAKRYGIPFRCGGRVIDGKRAVPFTAEQLLTRKCEKAKTGTCPDCGEAMNFDSRYCRKCEGKHRPERSRKRVMVRCLNCDTSFEKTPWQVVRYPHHFCCRGCFGDYQKTMRPKWAK